MQSPFKFCFKWLLVIASFLTAVASSFGQSSFDPANDDTDLFLANSNIASERPNILIVLDNTANWNTAFTNEQSALVSVVNGLSDAYNVGLMMFPETGGGNDSIDGGYVKFGVRQMTAANKSALASIVGGLDKLNDKANNATTGLAFYEAYLYFGGRTAVAGFGKVKRDFAGNAVNNPLAAALPGNAFADAATRVYSPAIGNNCQKNFIIYISNGPAAENASARSQLETYLTALKGGIAPTPIAINPSGQQGNWVDEMAQFMANNDVSSSATGTQNVITYTVEVDPGTTGQGPDMTALMKSTAGNGKGKYFAVSSGGTGGAIVSALNQIFSEIQAVNSVFAAASLPVSANVRGTNLNQVYVGVFRPDAQRLPRWMGNLKMYQFAINSATNAVYLAGADPTVPAQSSSTGFIVNTVTSLWSSNSSFWSFRSPYASTDIGQASDAPDGDLVEKGGAAQRLRTKYAAAEASSPARSMYTCTTGTVNCTPACVNGTCSGGGSLISATPFSTANADLTAAAFGLNTQPVNPLSASISQGLTSVSDTLPLASLTNVIGVAIPVTLNNGTVSKTITSITSSATLTLTSLVAGSTTATIAAASGCAYVGGGTKIATVNTIAAHGLTTGQSVTITGNTLCNGTYTILTSGFTTTAFQFSANLGGSNSTVNGGTVTGPTGTLTATFTNHGFGAGQPLTIANAADATYNGNYTIASVTANTFTFVRSSPPATASTTLATAFSQILVATVNATAHGFTAGASVIINGGASGSGYNGTYVIFSSPAVTANAFTIPLTTRAGDVTATGMSASGGGSTTVIASTVGGVPHGFATGATVSVAGASPTTYNSSYSITLISTTQFSFTTASVLAAATGSITATGGVAGTTATLTTSYPHGLAVGNTFQTSGLTGDPNWNSSGVATWTVAAPLTATSLTFSTVAVNGGAPLGAATGSGVVLGPPGGRRVWARLVAGHGYSTTGVGGAPQIKISGATPAGYNGTFNITVVPETAPLPSTVTTGSTVFTYLIAAGAGPQIGINTGTSVLASRPGTLATATSVNHGFISGDTVSITGATPTAFNSAVVSTTGSVVVNVIDSNTFTYQLATAQYDATGTVLASKSGGTGGGVSNLIRWIRGEDNAEDENINGSTTDVRASIHADVLHSRPLVINYNRGGTFPSGDNDVVIFYGTNGGVIQAVQGGIPSTVGADPFGNELWSFVPSEFFTNLNRLRNNSPKVSSSFKRPYFADGSFTAYIKNVGDLTKLGEAGDLVYIYATFRRGGRMIYAFDVSNPAAPRYLWKIDQSSPGFAELGQTWSKPVLIPAINGNANPVLLFGGGWDPAVEDIDPLTVASVSATGNVTKTDGTVVNRSMGRAIYMVDAITGVLLWRAEGTAAATTTCTAASGVVPAICQVPGFNYALPADPTVVRNDSGGLPGRAYIGDTGGQMWRLDFASADKSQWKVTKIASISNQALPSGRRKLLYSPDVVAQNGFDAVLVGTGDREHPFDTSVTNRMYMFKDTGNDSGPVTGVSTGSPTVVESAMYDATTATSSASINATAFAASQGWYITLRSGEKLTGSSVSLFGSTFFGTNQPDSAAGGGSCGANLGIARLYQISVADGTPSGVPVGASTTASASIVVPGGGFLPPPAFGMPNIPNTNPDGSACTTCGFTTRAVLCFGVQCIEPGSIKIGSRIRRYWYKDISE